MLTYFHWDEAKKISKIANSIKQSFSIPPILNIFSQKFQGLVLGLVESIDVKGINVAQHFESFFFKRNSFLLHPHGNQSKFLG